MPAERRSVNTVTMKRTPNRPQSSSNDLRAEYALDYGKARPNRFAARMSGDVVAVVLDADVARVFDSSKRVNDFLRSAISAMPARGRKGRTRRKSR